VPYAASSLERATPALCVHVREYVSGTSLVAWGSEPPALLLPLPRKNDRPRCCSGESSAIGRAQCDLRMSDERSGPNGAEVFGRVIQCGSRTSIDGQTMAIWPCARMRCMIDACVWRVAARIILHACVVWHVRLVFAIRASPHVVACATHVDMWTDGPWGTTSRARIGVSVSVGAPPYLAAG
jgi:hypothetical protein